MNKRYQVFLSSTFADLEEERKEVMSALQKAGYFVAGMELFPSDDDESWEVIKRVIDQSDYYVLVIAGRYGSIGKGGKSFTEMEYDYAKEQGLPVLAFLHSDRSTLPSKYVESKNPDKLEIFIKRVEKLHNRVSWSTKHDLAIQVLASISQTINLRPRIGWVRGTVADDNAELSIRLQDLQIKCDRLREERDSLASRPETRGEEEYLNEIAWGADEVEIVFDVTRESSGDTKDNQREKEKLSILVSWDYVFRLLAPKFIGWQYSHFVGRTLTPILLETVEGKSASLSEQSVEIIRTQLLALNLIIVETEERESSLGRRSYRVSVELWRLSEKGLHVYSVANALRKSPTPPPQSHEGK